MPQFFASPVAIEGRYSYGSTRRISVPGLIFSGSITALVGVTLLTALVAPDVLPRVDPPLVGTTIKLPPPPPKPVDDPVVKPPENPPIHIARSPIPAINNKSKVDATDKIPPSIPIDLGPTKDDAKPADPPPKPADPPAPPVLTKAVRTIGISFQPDYPTSKLREGTEGFARVRVKIGADGRVHDVVDAGSSDSDFFAATRRQALSRWRFRPATRDGIAIDSWEVITVRFTINAKD